MSFEAVVIQFLRPNGRQQPITTSLPDEYEILYEEMVRWDHRIEAEVLQAGEVSITISDGEDDIDIEITPNNGNVQDGMIRMLKRARWREQEDVQEAETRDADHP